MANDTADRRKDNNDWSRLLNRIEADCDDLLCHLCYEWIGRRYEVEFDWLKMFGQEALPKIRKPWVARILGPDEKYRWQREFMRSNTSYLNANSVGSRGVELHFFVPRGVYQVQYFTSWRCRVKEFLCVSMGRSHTIDETDVMSWLRKLSVT